MDNNTISAIIGFWRMEADIEQIIGITGLSFDVILNVIANHVKQIKANGN